MKSLSLSKPHAIILVGIPGSGKSFFASKFAETFSAPYVNFDYVKSITEDKKSASKVTSYLINEITKSHASIVVEVPASTRTERIEIAKLVRMRGYTPLLIWVQVDQATAEQRFVKSKNGSKESFEAQIKRFSAPHSLEKPVVISGKHTYATQAKIILKHLSAPRVETTTVKAATPDRPGRIIIR